MNHPPSVDSLARSIKNQSLPWPILVDIARQAIDTDYVSQVDDLADQRSRQFLQPVINATGVLLHTNMGRAPTEWSQAATFSNLEIDLRTGQRGSRQKTVGDLLAIACGAESALVVNNCASAVLLGLAALGAGQGVAVSRSELVEIGGGFRVPDVMRQSAANLVEVGTTNRSRLSDFKQVVDSGQATLTLKVHQSNYKIVGFTEEVSVAQLATLDAPLLCDVGSGLLDKSCPWIDGKPPSWLEDEPAVKQTLEAGANLVMFSGDKLFGGPQAGILVGDAKLVAKCAKHPLARALRPGGLVLGALQQTTSAYLDRRGQDIAFWKMATTPIDELDHRGRLIIDRVERAKNLSSEPQLSLTDTEAVPGGGTLPTVTIPSRGLRIPTDVTPALRSHNPAVIARVDDNSTILDLRTIAESEVETVASAIRSALR